MELLHAIILGAVEGVTEFLPISSTGHLIVTSRLLGLPETDFLKSFEIAIQLGAIAAVALVERRTLLSGPAVWSRIVAAFLPTAIVGLALHDFVKERLLGSVSTVGWALLIGGIALVAFERWHRGRPETVSSVTAITHRQAFWIGLAQSVAVIPGVSRSAATIVGGLGLGLSRATVVEFSFLLAIPTMAAATGLDLLKSYGTFAASDMAALAAGGVTAFLVAFLSLRFLLSYVRTRGFEAFGFYRMAIGVLILLTIA